MLNEALTKWQNLLDGDGGQELHAPKCLKLLLQLVCH